MPTVAIIVKLSGNYENKVTLFQGFIHLRISLLIFEVEATIITIQFKAW